MFKKIFCQNFSRSLPKREIEVCQFRRKKLGLVMYGTKCLYRKTGTIERKYLLAEKNIAKKLQLVIGDTRKNEGFL